MEGDNTSAMDTEYTIKNPVPLAQLNLSVLDSQTRLILEEKEQALLASQETVQVKKGNLLLSVVQTPLKIIGLLFFSASDCP